MQQKLLGVRLQSWLALLVIIVATIIVTWPIAGQLGTHIPGSEGDVWEHLWAFEWVKGALSQGSDLFYTNLIFYPQGTSLATHNIAWVNMSLWLVLQAVVGSGAAYSLMMLTVFVFNGFAVYLFVYELTGRFSAAITAAMVAAFWPHILSHHNHPNLIVTAWVSLTLLALRRMTLSGQRRYAFLAGVFLALVGLTRWQTLVLGGIVIGFYLLYLFVANQSSLSIRARVLLLSLTMGVALLLMLPLFLAQFSQAPELVQTITEVVDGSDGQSDLLAYFLPSRFHPWWGEAVFARFYGPLQTNKVFVPFLGYTVLSLVVIGVVWCWRRTRFWLGVALLYILLALGPTLLINGRSYIPLPYRLLESTFLGALIRSPDRFNVFLSVPVAVMVGFGVKVILQHPRLKRPLGLGLVALTVLLILIEYSVRYPTFLLDDYPTWYSTLAQEPDEFGILELPMSDRSYDEVYMHYQTVHGKPIVGGSIARPSKETFAFINSLSMLAGVPEEKSPPEDVVNVGSQLTTLSQAGVKYIVFHKKFMGAERLQQWRDWLLVAPYYEDEELLVYETNWVVGESLPFIPVTDSGLGIISADVQPTSTTQDGWVEVTIQWGAQEALPEPYDVCFLLENTAGVVAADSCFPVSTVWPTDLWPQNEMVASNYLLHMSPYLATDNYTILAEVGGGEHNQTVVVGHVDFSAHPRFFSETAVTETLAEWDSKIALLNYQVHQPAANTVELDVEWLALKRMEQSYKVFVHIIDSQTQALVSQSDAVPQDWGYPTNWWEQGELISDTLHLSLPVSTSGEYEVWLGIYNLVTNDALLVSNSADSLLAEENRVHLAHLVVDSQGFIE
ncbi:MAG: hypothetical protein WAM60_07125 [Candidatus Promineifilaceae bacterium]